jgi:hypothetical protein
MRAHTARSSQGIQACYQHEENIQTLVVLKNTCWCYDKRWCQGCWWISNIPAEKILMIAKSAKFINKDSAAAL